MSSATDIFSHPRGTAPDPLLERLRSVTLGEYEIRGELGRGGMAVVYLAKDIRLERAVAIKVMLPELLRTEGMAERFLLEARISARLQHPNIIIVHDVRHREELIYFVMGLVDGCGLDEITRAGTLLPFDDVRWILLQAAQALSYANGEGIVHRDVKPGNILLSLKGDVLVTDFGIAKVAANTSRSMGATIIGTPLYMSPEQVTGQQVSEASDQYSLGITAYSLLTGIPPFSGDLGLYDLQTAHVRTRPVSLQTRRPDCPPALAAAVMRMLEKRQEDRWPSLAELVPVLASGLPHDGREIKQRLGVVATGMRNANEQRSRVIAIETPVTPRPGVPPRPKPAVIVVSPPSATLYVSAGLTLSAKVLTRAGDAIHDAIVAWTSSDTAVASVSPIGELLAVGPGTASIRAAIGSVYEETVVTVVLSPITRLELLHDVVSLMVGDTVRPTVRAIDAQGAPRMDASCAWLSRNAGTVQVVGVGELLGVTIGEAVVEVAAGTAHTSLRVRVTPRPAATVRVFADAAIIEYGDASAMRIEAFDDRGTLIAAPRVAWSSSAPHVVHVDSAGTAIGLSPGRATLTAAVDGVSSAVVVTVVEAPIAGVAITVSPIELEPGDTAHVALAVTDASGRPRSEEGVSIVSDNTAVLRVLGDGRTVAAVAAGDARIIARFSDPAVAAGVTANPVSVAVRFPVVDRVLLSAASLELEIGAMVAVTARCQDAKRRPLPDPSLAWESLDPAVIAVDARGQLRALAAGQTVVRVTAFGAHDSAVSTELPVRVRPASVATIRVSTETSRMLVGTSQALHVVMLETTGAVVADRSAVFSSSDPRVARVDASGLLSAVAEGQVTVSALLDGQRGDVVVHVDRAPVTALRIVSPDARVTVGTAMPCSVLATDAEGETRDVRVTWSVEPPAAATVRADGTVVARRAGPFVLIADAAGLRDTCTIEADASPVVDVATEASVERPVVGTSRTPRSNKWMVGAVGVIAAIATGVVLATREPREAPGPQPPPSAPPQGIVINYQLPQNDGLPVGSQLQLRALTRDGNVPVAEVRWSVSPARAATVDPSSGLLVAQRPDTVRVTATTPTDSVAVATFVIVPKDAVAPTVTKGELLITGLPAGGSIRVDGRQRSEGRVELEQGRHAVHMEAPGYTAFETSVEIAAGRTRTLAFQGKAEVKPPEKSPGMLKLGGNWEAVFVNGERKGDNGLASFALPEGRHALRFERPNFITVDTVVLVKRADTLKIRINLQQKP